MCTVCRAIDEVSWSHLQLKTQESSVVGEAGFCTSCDEWLSSWDHWLPTSSPSGGLSLTRKPPIARDSPSPENPLTLSLHIPHLPSSLLLFLPAFPPSSCFPLPHFVPLFLILFPPVSPSFPLSSLSVSSPSLLLTMVSGLTFPSHKLPCGGGNIFSHTLKN